jgi:hypothetical protein
MPPKNKAKKAVKKVLMTIDGVQEISGSGSNSGRKAKPDDNQSVGGGDDSSFAFNEDSKREDDVNFGTNDSKLNDSSSNGGEGEERKMTDENPTTESGAFNVIKLANELSTQDENNTILDDIKAEIA